MVSLPDLWQNLLTTSKSDEIFSLETADGSFVSYRVDSFLSRTRKVATAFREKLKVVPGSRVALLIDDPAEFAPVAHAMWFLRAVVVHLSSSYSDQQLVEVIDNTSTQIVVFSLPLAARIAKITPKASGVREWVVSGSAAANQESSMSTVEGLISGISESDEMLDSVIGSDLALVSFTRGSRGPRFGVGFSQE